MFNFKHEIEFTTKESVFLFGEDYYNDKKVFWDTHQNKLIHLCKKIKQIGFPIKIKDLKQDHELIINAKSEFNSWFLQNYHYLPKLID